MSVSVNQGGSITFWQMEQINSEPVRSCRVCERMRRIQLCTVHAAVQSLYSFFSFHKLICKSMYKITALSSWSMLLTNYLISQVAPTAACCHVKTKQPHLFPSTHADCTLSSWIMLFSSLPDTVTEQRGNVDRVSQLKMHMCCLHAISNYFYFIQHGETWQGDASPAPLLMHTNGKACLFSHFFCLSPSLSGDTLSELAAAITCVLTMLSTYLASVRLGCQALDYLLTPIMMRTGENLRLAGRIIGHNSSRKCPMVRCSRVLYLLELSTSRESSPRCLG